MHKIQSTTGFRGFGETSWEGGNVTDAYAATKNIISIANSVPLSFVLKFYNIKFHSNKKITCPFRSHSNGKESTPSFKYYPETNSFFCYGCSTGGSCVEFVCNMDNIKPLKAANKIITIYGDDASKLSEQLENSSSFSERIKLYMGFSDYVYDFIQKHKNNEDAMKFIHNITFMYDKLNQKDQSNEALESIIFKLKDLIDKYAY